MDRLKPKKKHFWCFFVFLFTSFSFFCESVKKTKQICFFVLVTKKNFLQKQHKNKKKAANKKEFVFLKAKTTNI